MITNYFALLVLSVIVLTFGSVLSRRFSMHYIHNDNLNSKALVYIYPSSFQIHKNSAKPPACQAPFLLVREFICPLIFI